MSLLPEKNFEDLSEWEAGAIFDESSAIKQAKITFFAKIAIFAVFVMQLLPCKSFLKKDSVTICHLIST